MHPSRLLSTSPALCFTSPCCVARPWSGCLPQWTPRNFPSCHLFCNSITFLTPFLISRRSVHRENRKRTPVWEVQIEWASQPPRFAFCTRLSAAIGDGGNRERNSQFHLSSPWQWEDYQELIGQINSDLAASPVKLPPTPPNPPAPLPQTAFLKLSSSLPFVKLLSPPHFLFVSYHYLISVFNSLRFGGKRFIVIFNVFLFLGRFLYSLHFPFPHLPFCFSSSFNSNLWISPIWGFPSLALLPAFIGIVVFQSSICGEQSLLIPTWIQPFVSQTSGGGGWEGADGTRQPLWFATGPGPTQHWPCPKQVTPPCPRPLSPSCRLQSLPPSHPSVLFLFQPSLSLISLFWESCILFCLPRLYRLYFFPLFVPLFHSQSLHFITPP